MNLVFIRYFLVVADTGNFTAAAERCHVTQPTLSAGIARLEEEVGARLFDRGRRSGLSAAGHRLLPHARAMADAWQSARAEAREPPAAPRAHRHRLDPAGRRGHAMAGGGAAPRGVRSRGL